MFESEVFRKQMYWDEESSWDIVGTFWRSPQSFGAGEFSLFTPPRYAPGLHRRILTSHIFLYCVLPVKFFVEVLDTDFDYICFWICVIVVYTTVISKHHN